MTDTPLRFVHTADWQLGLRARFIPDDAGAAVRDARLRTVRRIGELARERDADFVVVAGDVFESHGLRPRTVRQSFDVLARFPCPVYLLPGNHDPYTPDALYRSTLWANETPQKVHVLASTEPVPVREDAHLLPCPIRERHGLEDPTAHLDDRFGPREGFRIGVAHGGIREILEGLQTGDEGYELSSSISRDTAERGALDYLALGDWHGLLRVGERAWYPGTPEATRFKEKKPGHVLLVEIAAPGATPEVTPVAVQGLRWLRLDEDLDDDDAIRALGEAIDVVPGKAQTLLELRLRGTLDIGQHTRLLEEIIEPTRDRFRWLRVRDDELHVFVRPQELAEVAGEGWLHEVVEALERERSDEAQGALRLLYRLAQEEAR